MTAPVIVPHDTLLDHLTLVLQAAGSEPGEAGIVARHLVEANLRGHDSHGAGMLPNYVQNVRAGRLIPNRHAEFLRRDGAFASVDGGMGYGQVIARETMDWAIAAARTGGIALAGLGNTHHIGRVGDYGEQACAAGLISIHFVNGTMEPRVAPFRGSDPRLNTNPVCIAVPRGDGVPPVVLDFATSRIAFGKVRVAHNDRHPVPPGALIAPDGQPTTDPDVLFAAPPGSLLPFGEHKGYGLALICEVLGGALTGGGTGHPGNDPSGRGIRNGMLAIVIDPARLADLAFFRDEIGAMLDYVTASPPVDPAAPILLPGEPERLTRARRLADGIPVDATTWAEIADAARSVGVAPA